MLLRASSKRHHDGFSFEFRLSKKEVNQLKAADDDGDDGATGLASSTSPPATSAPPDKHDSKSSKNSSKSNKFERKNSFLGKLFGR